MNTRLLPSALLLALTPATFWGCAASTEPRCFELRTYTAADGRLDDLHARFRDHTCRIFETHGMEVVGFWTPTDGDEAESTLVYMLAFPSRQAAGESWKAFFEDEEWKAVRKKSVANGDRVSKVESVYLRATDYSAMK